MYRSQIRDSEINEMFQKVENANYEKYLHKVFLKKVRGFIDQTISFDFPVTAILGPNGGGKTTVLGAAAIIYQEMRPRQLFARNHQIDKDMRDWTIECELTDKTLDRANKIRKSASFKTEKWRRDLCTRPVLFFGVSRTLPAVERKDMLRFAARGSLSNSKLLELKDSARPYITTVLGKNVDGFRQLSNKGHIELLAGKTFNNVDYSEFHFGAGESSIIKMILQIENSDDGTLVIIEEIENGLHPVATRLLVEYLIKVSKRKKLQVIFSTHSDFAIEPLPQKAIWAVIGGSVFQGKLSVETLRSVVGDIPARLIVYVEDVFAKSWLRAIISLISSNSGDEIEVHAIGGDGTAVNINKYHNQDPAKKCDSICFVDGDSRQTDDGVTIYRLPGQAPESYIFDNVMEAWDSYGTILTVRLSRLQRDTDTMRTQLKQVRDSTTDHHLLFSRVAETLFLPEPTVIEAFLSTWCQAYTDESGKISAVLQGHCKDN